MTTVTTQWHDGIDINGAPYPTRHPATEDTGSSTLNDLTDHHRDSLRAHHEAAHAIAALAGGGHVHYAKIATTAHLRAKAAESPGAGAIAGGDVYICNLSDGRGNAIFFGAGERAEDHWLHQNNLWTPRRAVGIELGAYGDRSQFLAVNPHFGFGADHNDYRVVHDLADQLITQHWAAITIVAEVLVSRLHLTGQQIADLAQMPNGTHSATCTFAA
ncbi:hypothetical protein ACFU98_29545 [Streptomyces sp. NPDC057575]|uniref:hypothetical protein n=1 Tax=unclassified Streptomyces TaxID=2593676 RepID=UPI0036C2B1D9